MYLHPRLRFVGIGFLAIALALSPAANAYAQKRVKWKMQSAFGSTLDVVGESGPKFSENLKVMSNGALELEFYEPGALVPALEIFTAVSAGSIDAGWTTPGYHTGRIPSASFFTGVPFGPAAGEYIAWLKFGGGHELKDEIYARHGVRGISCTLIPPEASGWFREEVKTASDLKGIKMRFFGMGAKVMQKLGVSTQLLAPGDIYPALERGVIDATELSFPSIDYNLGFYQVAKHYYFPGWHNQSAIGELLVNLKKFNALSETHQRMIEIACDANMTWTYAASESRQFVAMRKLVNDHGVTIHFWSDEILLEMSEAWQVVILEESARDPDFRRVYESYADFRKRYAIWREHGYLK